MSTNNNIFILTWVAFGKVTPIIEHPNVQIIQLKRKELSKLSQYKKGIFEVRTKDGLKHKQILKS